MKHVTMKEIERLSRESARILYGDADASCVSPIVSATGSVSHTGACQGQSFSDMNVESVASVSMNTMAFNRPQKNALIILRAQSAQRFPFLLRSEAALLAGMRGSASLLNAEKAALESGYIIKHEIPRGKTRVVFWEITDCGYAAIETGKPQTKSKGHYVHKFSAHRIADAFKMRGNRVKIEHRISTGKLVDIAIHGAEGVRYVEVCSSYPLEKELINLERDLAGGETPKKLIFAVTQRRMKDALSRLIEEYMSLRSAPCPVSVVLAGDLIEPLALEGRQ